MDMLLLLMGLVLLMAGWFLMWEFARFLHCAYVIQGQVISMEPGFGLKKHLAHLDSDSGNYSFFPVIQYEWMGEPTRFTTLDQECISGLQIGDRVKLSFSRTRRAQSRIGRMVFLLLVCMALLVAGIVGSTIAAHGLLDIGHILMASFVLAVGLCIIVLYTRQQDETNPDTRYPQAQAQSVLNVFLLEPTNVCYWKRLFTNRSQRRRIMFSKMVGGCCFMAGMFMLVSAVVWGGMKTAAVVPTADSPEQAVSAIDLVQLPLRQACSFSTHSNTFCGA